MGACGFVLGVWPGLLHSILSLFLAVLTGVMLFGFRRQDFSSIRLPLAPFFCIGGVTAYWLAAAAAVICTNGGINLNKNIFRNRTIIGAVCILLAVLVCFGITPLFNAGLKAQTEAVRVKAEVIPRGTYITADMVEVYTRGASGMSDAIATSLDEVVGRYTDVELRKNTDVNTGWLSSEPLTQYEYLTKLDGSKVAISVTIPTFAKGGSGKVEAGDIIMLFATDKDTGETTQPPELKYVEVLAATQSSGADKEYQAPQDDEEENPEESLPSTITLLVNTEQAQLLAHLEESNSLHLAFVYRGTRENAEKFLAAQDQFFVEPEEDTAAQDGEQGEVSGDNNVADNTGDNAAGNEPAEEQEVENTDGE